MRPISTTSPLMARTAPFLDCSARPIVAVCIAMALALGLGLSACGKTEKKAAKQNNTALATLISGFSGGTISADGPIKVIFVNPVPDSASLNVTLEKNPFDITPGVKGPAVWTDARTLEFRPSERLKRGETYQVALNLDKILTVPETLRKLEFKVTVMRQHFETDLGGLEVVSESDLGWQRLGGLLRLADGEEAPAVEKMLTAFQDGKPVTVRWEHRPDRREHPFRVDSLRRGEDSSRLVLKWDGGPVGAEAKREDTVIIPSLGAFQVMSVTAAKGDEAYVSVRFSDPPQKGLDFRGLIEVPEQGGLRYQAQGNEVRVYSSSEWNGTKTVQVSEGVRNIYGKALKNPGGFVVVFEEVKPGVRFTGKGVILPGNGNLTLPFEAVNLRSVRVSVVRIFAGNVPQFLQVNDLEGQYELQRVGRSILTKTVALNPTASMRPRWARYALDLTDLARKDPQPGALYRVTLSFKRSQSTYPCADSGAVEEEEALQNWDEDKANQASGWDGIESYYDGEEYDWSQREDPCSPSYYKYGRTASRNFLASDIGLLVKSAGGGTESRPGKLQVVATDLLSAQPLKDVELEALNYQHQAVGKGRTDGDGFAELEVSGKPFLLRAVKGDQRGYLKIDDPSALQMGRFDVGGLAVRDGLKGYLFGERGVWRPGDSLYLTFILEDRQGRLPAGHPVSLELKDPQGRVTRSLTRSSDGGFYSFATATDPDAPTGVWLAQVKAGPAVFEERLKIETVVPNRLKIKAEFSPKPLVRGEPVKGNLDVYWLSGAVAKHLEADVEMTLESAKPEFPTFTDYVFSDPVRRFEPETQALFQGRIDANGRASFSRSVQVSGKAPGALRANFRTRVMEVGGAFSVDRISETFHPYGAYVGIKLPPGDRERGMLLTDTLHPVKLCLLDPQGRKLGKRRVEVKLSKVEWRWWWEQDQQNASYLTSESGNLLQEDTVTLTGGEGTWGLKVKYPEWGRYLVRVCDLDGGKEAHCTGKVFYMDWPGWAGRAQREGPGGGAAVLSFSSDKPKYTVGEKARLTIPSPKCGRALVSIEKGGTVLKRYWVDLKEKETVHEIETTPAMSPNVYVFVTLLQPHARTENDLPIRLYNVVPIQVEDPATRLSPEVKVDPGVFRPGEKAVLTVSEKSGKPMQYVAAVVDEGLLDLTRFPTPDPWKRFYAREALGVKTWDLFDFVAGAYGSRLERLLSIGGDEEGLKNAEGRKGNRFPPMVRFLGPFTLEKGKQARHELAIPQYVGSVRVMIVAGRDGAYGFAEKAVPVRKPLMVLGTLPRVLSPGDSFALPISVFAMEQHVRDVEVTVTATSPVRLSRGSKRTLVFKEPGDEVVVFGLEAGQAEGWAKVTIKAKSGSEQAEQTMEVEVRNPNSRITTVVPALVQPGATWSHAFKPIGAAGGNKAVLELSRIPPLDLGKRLGYLVRYPHGCVEQTTSGAFPQLYLESLMDLPKAYKADVEKHVKAAIYRLKGFQGPSGGFGFWPGDQYVNDWGSTYAGHFLVEAEKQGYSLPTGVLDQWKKFQRTQAQGWSAQAGGDNSHSQLAQAYRLYTLALAGSPEMGAMNRLKESKTLYLPARWQLGGAYQLAGQAEVAESLVKGAAEVKPYVEQDGTFGSDLRDKAMMLEVLSLMGRKTEATPLMQDVAAGLSKSEVLSTQTTAYSLIAMARYAGRNFDRGNPVPFSLKVNGTSQDGRVEAPILQKEIKLKEDGDNQLEVSNKGTGQLYARLILEGVPPLGKEQASNEGIELDVSYKDMKGESLDPSKLEQGQDFVAEFAVRHPGNRAPLRQLALSSVFPSGWEIRNTRMDPTQAMTSQTSKKPRAGAWFLRPETEFSMFEHQAFRDDRVHTYFHLKTGEQKVFRFFLNAAYLGTYRLPQSKVEAMYDPGVHARTQGMKVEVTQAEGEAGDPSAEPSLGRDGGGSGNGSRDGSGDDE